MDVRYFMSKKRPQRVKNCNQNENLLSLCPNLLQRYLKHQETCKRRTDSNCSQPSCKAANASGPPSPTITICDQQCVMESSHIEIPRVMQINNIVDEWAENIPVYDNERIIEKTARAQMIKDLKTELSLIIDAPDCKQNTRITVERIIKCLPMWFPPHDPAVGKKIKKEMADDLIQKLHDIIDQKKSPHNGVDLNKTFKTESTHNPYQNTKDITKRKVYRSPVSIDADDESWHSSKKISKQCPLIAAIRRSFENIKNDVEVDKQRSSDTSLTLDITKHRTACCSKQQNDNSTTHSGLQKKKINKKDDISEILFTSRKKKRHNNKANSKQLDISESPSPNEETRRFHDRDNVIGSDNLLRIRREDPTKNDNMKHNEIKPPCSCSSLDDTNKMNVEKRSNNCFCNNDKNYIKSHYDQRDKNYYVSTKQTFDPVICTKTYGLLDDVEKIEQMIWDTVDLNIADVPKREVRDMVKNLAKKLKTNPSQSNAKCQINDFVKKLSDLTGRKMSIQLNNKMRQKFELPKNKSDTDVYNNHEINNIDILNSFSINNAQEEEKLIWETIENISELSDLQKSEILTMVKCFAQKLHEINENSSHGREELQSEIIFFLRDLSKSTDRSLEISEDNKNVVKLIKQLELMKQYKRDVCEVVVEILSPISQITESEKEKLKKVIVSDIVDWYKYVKNDSGNQTNAEIMNGVKYMLHKRLNYVLSSTDTKKALENKDDLFRNLNSIKLPDLYSQRSQSISEQRRNSADEEQLIWMIIEKDLSLSRVNKNEIRPYVEKFAHRLHKLKSSNADGTAIRNEVDAFLRKFSRKAGHEIDTITQNLFIESILGDTLITTESTMSRKRWSISDKKSYQESSRESILVPEEGYPIPYCFAKQMSSGCPFKPKSCLDGIPRNQCPRISQKDNDFRDGVSDIRESRAEASHFTSPYVSEYSDHYDHHDCNDSSTRVRNPPLSFPNFTFNNIKDSPFKVVPISSRCINCGNNRDAGNLSNVYNKIPPPIEDSPTCGLEFICNPKELISIISEYIDSKRDNVEKRKSREEKIMELVKKIRATNCDPRLSSDQKKRIIQDEIKRTLLKINIDSDDMPSAAVAELTDRLCRASNDAGHSAKCNDAYPYSIPASLVTRVIPDDDFQINDEIVKQNSDQPSFPPITTTATNTESLEKGYSGECNCRSHCKCETKEMSYCENKLCPRYLPPSSPHKQCPYRSPKRLKERFDDVESDMVKRNFSARSSSKSGRSYKSGNNNLNQNANERARSRSYQKKFSYQCNTHYRR